MNTRTLVLAIILAGIALSSCRYERNNRSYSNYTFVVRPQENKPYQMPEWFKKIYENDNKKINPKTVSAKNYKPIQTPQNINRYNNTSAQSNLQKYYYNFTYYPKQTDKSSYESYKPKQLKKVDKKSLWKVFDYMNSGYYQSQECREKKQNGSTDGCCIRGQYYTDEKCWLTLISLVALGAATLVGLFCIIFFTCGILCCIAVKRLRRKKILELIKQRQVTLAAKPATTAVSVATSAPVKKCTCPPKRVEKSINSSVSSTSNDFGYVPPKILNTPKVVQAQPEFNYPKFEEVNVNNPYPKFEMTSKNV